MTVGRITRMKQSNHRCYHNDFCLIDGDDDDDDVVVVMVVVVAAEATAVSMTLRFRH